MALLQGDHLLLCVAASLVVPDITVFYFWQGGVLLQLSGVLWNHQPGTCTLIWPGSMNAGVCHSFISGFSGKARVGSQSHQTTSMSGRRAGTMARQRMEHRQKPGCLSVAADSIFIPTGE